MSWRAVLVREYESLDEFMREVINTGLYTKLRYNLRDELSRDKIKVIQMVLYRLFNWQDFSKWHDNLLAALYKCFALMVKHDAKSIYRILDIFIRERNKIPVRNLYYFLIMLSTILDEIGAGML